MPRASLLDKTKMIDQNQWAVTIGNTQNYEKSDLFKPLKWAGHAVIVIEAILFGEYCAYYGHLRLDKTLKVPLSMVSLERPSVETIDRLFNRPKGKGETYLCEAEKVWRLFLAIEEEEKVCKEIFQGVERGSLTEEHVRDYFDYPQFDLFGRHTIFMIKNKLKIGDDYPSKEAACAAVNKIFAKEMDMIKSKLSIVQKGNIYQIIKKPDNCLTWVKAMLAYYCDIQLKKEQFSVLFSVPSAHIEPEKAKVLNALSIVPEFFKLAIDVSTRLKQEVNEKLSPFKPVAPVQAGIASTFPAWVCGAEAWKKYIGDPGVEPPLPPEIIQRLGELNANNVLVLIPETINGSPLELKLMGEHVQKPLQGYATKYSYLDLGEYVDRPAPKSHWALLTRTVIEGSRNKLLKNEQAVIDSYNLKTGILYEAPTILDATVCNFMEYVRFGTWLYSDNPLTYTWCQEKYNDNYHLVVGGGSAAGLLVYSNKAFECHGVGGLRKF